MRKILIITCFTLLPMVGTAQTTTNAEPPGYSLKDITLISAGAVAGILTVHFLIGETLTIPVVNTITPAMQEASAAGAVFGSLIAGATAIKDAKARADMFYALTIGTGAILGALTLNHIWHWTTSSPAIQHSK